MHGGAYLEGGEMSNVKFALTFVTILLTILLPIGLPSAASAPRLYSTTNSSTQNSRLSFEGTLDIAYGDAMSGDNGETIYMLALLNGTRIPLLFKHPSQLAGYFLKRVSVVGQVMPNQLATSHSQALSAIMVDEITASSQQAQQSNQPLVPSVTGTRKVIMLLLKFSDDSAVPHPPSFYSDLINPSTPPAGIPATVNGFYRNASWNQFYWVAEVGGLGGVPATDWLTLPYPKSHYAPCGWSSACADLNAIINDGTAAGVSAGIYFPSYDNVNFVLSNDLDCCAWGGGFTKTLNGVYKSYGATWEPPWGQEAGTYSHEMGHSLGLPHSGWVYYAYDSPWDVMSAAHQAAVSVSCGSYYSRNSAATNTLYCDNPGDGISAPYKDYLGWIDSSHEVVTSTTSHLTVTLDGAALPLGTPKKMIKICISGFSCDLSSATAHYFTVEARVGSQYGDGGIPGEGIIIHMFEQDRPVVGGPCFFNSQSGWAWPIDSTPGDYDSVACNPGGRTYPNYALFNAQWLPGSSYVNGPYGLTVQIVSRSGSSYTVVINPSETILLSTDLLVWRPTGGTWFVRHQDGSNWNQQWGLPGDISLLGDVDGDGVKDLIVWRPSNGVWYILKSSANYAGWVAYQWGLPGDVPLIGDFDADGKVDLIVWRPSSGTWYILKSSSGYTEYFVKQWGLQGDTPLLADLDGDRKPDLIVWRPSNGNWYILRSSTGYTGYTIIQWGLPGDVPLLGDFDRDGNPDLFVWRPSSGTWYVLKSSSGYTQYFIKQWGLSGDVPLLMDYDGDGNPEFVVWRPSNGVWHILKSSANYAGWDTPSSWVAIQWGLNGDTPLTVT